MKQFLLFICVALLFFLVSCGSKEVSMIDNPNITSNMPSEEEEYMPKIYTSCEYACEKYKQCKSYENGVWPQDLDNEYEQCISQCDSRTKEEIDCVNMQDITSLQGCAVMRACIKN